LEQHPGPAPFAACWSLSIRTVCPLGAGLGSTFGSILAERDDLSELKVGVIDKSLREGQ
jgi:hypothetical protein